MNHKGPRLYLTEANTCFSLPSAMLFHGLPGGDIHGVLEEMERRGKTDSAAISSAIDMGERETVCNNAFLHFYKVKAAFGRISELFTKS